MTDSSVSFACNLRTHLKKAEMKRDRQILTNLKIIFHLWCKKINSQKFREENWTIKQKLFKIIKQVLSLHLKLDQV